MDTEMMTDDAKWEHSQRRFVVNLLVREGVDPQVRSCEVQTRAFRNRTSFTGVCGIDDVFEEKVADGVKACLRQLSLETKVLSLPECVIQTTGLLLAGVHMMSSYADDGTVAVILRFKLFIGGINRAFQPQITLEDSVDNHTETLAALVLSDISMPLLDLCAAAEAGLSGAAGQLTEFGRALSEKSHEIRFRVELVKRYVDGIDRFEPSRGIPNEPANDILQLRSA